MSGCGRSHFVTMLSSIHCKKQIVKSLRLGTLNIRQESKNVLKQVILLCAGIVGVFALVDQIIYIILRLLSTLAGNCLFIFSKRIDKHFR